MWELAALKNFGDNPELMGKELIAAKKLIAKEGGELEKCYERELAAAQAFARVEELVRESRDKELHKAIDAK